MNGVALFQMHRDRDVTGYSGTGHVADGCVFPDGTTVLRWRVREGKVASTEVFGRWQDLEAVHGHDGASRLIWAAGPPAPISAGGGRVSVMPPSPRLVGDRTPPDRKTSAEADQEDLVGNIRRVWVSLEDIPQWSMRDYARLGPRWRPDVRILLAEIDALRARIELQHTALNDLMTDADTRGRSSTQESGGA